MDSRLATQKWIEILGYILQRRKSWCHTSEEKNTKTIKEKHKKIEKNANERKCKKQLTINNS